MPKCAGRKVKMMIGHILATNSQATLAWDRPALSNRKIRTIVIPRSLYRAIYVFVG